MNLNEGNHPHKVLIATAMLFWLLGWCNYYYFGSHCPEYGCFITRDNITRVCGNFYDVMNQSVVPKDRTEMILTMEGNITPQVDMYRNLYTLNETTTTTTEPATTTTHTTCPDTAIPRKLEKELLNLPRTVIGDKPAAVQHGCYLCMQQTWETLQLPNRPKFYPGPSKEAGADYYRPTQAINDSMFCFMRGYGYNHGMSGEGFYLNASSWRWNNTPQYYDIATDTFYSNGSFKETRIDTYSNTSDNLWVQVK